MMRKSMGGASAAQGTRNGERRRRVSRVAVAGIVLGAVLVAFVAFLVFGLDWLAGEGRFGTAPIPLGSYAVPMSASPRSADLPHLPTQVGQGFVRRWAEIIDVSVPERGKRRLGPLVVLAKLSLGRDVEQVNGALQQLTPWTNSGSTWTFHRGDYDFAEVEFTTVLCMFGDRPDLLYPETVDHLVNVLLIEEGGRPRPKVPNTLGLVLDTENHHLMTESTRYLKNQWVFEHGSPGQRSNPRYDNAKNGLERWLLDYLKMMRDEGVYEFNSMPYLGVTLHSLLNLDAFARSAEVAGLARYLLDTMNWQYALGSLDLRRCAPFRRRTEYAGLTALDDDPHTDMMWVWASKHYETEASLDASSGGHSHHGLVAEVLPYRLPDTVRKWVFEKPYDYFVCFGRGAGASPEIYSGGPGYLLSAGGVNRGRRSLIAARPTSVMLSDGARDLGECFHLPGRGQWTEWNNTGVHQEFACSNAPVRVPHQCAPVATSGAWSVFAPKSVPGLLIVTFSKDNLGLIVLFRDWQGSADSLLEALQKANPSEEVLQTTFSWSDGRTIEYDVEAPKGTWVIKSVNGEPVNRDYDTWAQIEGDPPRITFDRAVR